MDAIERAIRDAGATVGGPLHTRLLLAEVAKPDHAWHGLFEWDDERAAQQFRLRQAQAIIGEAKRGTV